MKVKLSSFSDNSRSENCSREAKRRAQVMSVGCKINWKDRDRAQFHTHTRSIQLLVLPRWHTVQTAEYTEIWCCVMNAPAAVCQKFANQIKLSVGKREKNEQPTHQLSPQGMYWCLWNELSTGRRPTKNLSKAAQFVHSSAVNWLWLLATGRISGDEKRFKSKITPRLQQYYGVYHNNMRYETLLFSLHCLNNVSQLNVRIMEV